MRVSLREAPPIELPISRVDERFSDWARRSGVACGSLPEDERLDIDAQIDGLVAHAYGLSQSDLDVIFEDFVEASFSPT